jgi:hypothetical protein
MGPERGHLNYGNLPLLAAWTRALLQPEEAAEDSQAGTGWQEKGQESQLLQLDLTDSVESLRSLSWKRRG